MENKTVLTVIIPVYNVARFVKSAIRSVMAQPCRDQMEIIVVDDGSTDDSGKICDEVAKEGSNVKVIHQENKGVAATRNYAVSIAQGKYCAFLDADDWWDKDFFDADLCRELSENEIDIYGFSYRAISSDIVFYNRFHVETKTEYYTEYQTGRFFYYPFWAFIYRKAFLQENDLEEFLVKINEDSTFTERCFCVAKSVRWIDKNICNHWNNMYSVSRTMKWDVYFDEHYKSYECMREWHAKYHDTYDVDSRAAIIFCVTLPDLCANNSYRFVREYVDGNDKFNVIYRYQALDMPGEYKKLLSRWTKHPRRVWLRYRTLGRAKQDMLYFVYSHPKLNHAVNTVLYSTVFKHDRLSPEELRFIKKIKE